MDHVADLKRTPFILAGRAVSTIQLQVLGNIKDHIRSEGSVIINLAPNQAQALGKELRDLARKGRFNGQN